MQKTQETDVRRDEHMILCDNLVKIYKTKDIEVLALQGLELVVDRGELMAIVGNSGSGKSTFLNMIGGIDRPSAGRLIVDGKDLFKLNDAELVKYKRETVGFMWQNNARNLLPWLPAWQNVETPMLFGTEKERRRRAYDLLDLIGMGHRKHSRLSQLSGGEQQRIAIAIALANNPKILLADEPTGSVDRKTADYILDVFRRLNREFGLTVVMVTHDREIAGKVNRCVTIRDGKVASERLLPGELLAKMNELGGLAEGESPQGHEEFAILDRAGRLQIPREMLDELGVSTNKVRLAMETGENGEKRIVIGRE